MTEQEAKKRLQDIYYSNNPFMHGRRIEIEVAVSALEKQIPKEPLTKTLANDGYAWEWICPNCRIVKVTTEKQFCDDCGQRIDWSDHPTEKGGVQE